MDGIDPISKYWNQIQEHICSRCGDFASDQQCAYEEGRRCALFRHFNAIVRAIQSVVHPCAEAYELSLREHVCRLCPNQDKYGRCVLRNNLDCVLDRNFPAIVRVLSQERTTA